MSAIQKRLNKMEIAFDQEEFVVLDLGTGFIKAGFSGEDLPRCVIPTSIAEKIIEVDPSQQNNIAGMEQKAKINYTFGNGAIASRSTHDYHEPVSRGIVIDFDRVTRLLEHVFTNELGLKTANMNLLMTDSPVNTKENKQKICEIMFEHFKVKSFSLMNTAVLSLFSTGTTTGLVTECGSGLTYAVPIFEGYALPHAIHTLNIAGTDITQKLLQELKDCDAPVTDDHFFLVREMKEQMCHVARDFRQELKSRDDPLNQEQRSYELPSGQIIEVNHHKRMTASEIIFDPSLSTDPAVRGVDGVASIAHLAIEKCDSDLKINLYNNIVLAGGTTLMRGFTERFDYEIRNLAEQHAKTDINVSAALHRRYAAWIGGSMISSFSTFSDTTIKQSDYYDSQTESDRSTCILKKTVF